MKKIRLKLNAYMESRVEEEISHLQKLKEKLINIRGRLGIHGSVIEIKGWRKKPLYEEDEGTTEEGVDAGGGRRRRRKEATGLEGPMEEGSVYDVVPDRDVQG